MDIRAFIFLVIIYGYKFSHAKRLRKSFHKATTNNNKMIVGQLHKCTVNEKTLIPDEKEPYYCDFDENKKFSETNHGGGVYNNEGLIKYLNKDVQLAAKIDVLDEIQECICADFSGASVENCKDIFLCNINCNTILKRNPKLCRIDWYRHFCAAECGLQKVKTDKKQTKELGFPNDSYQFTVETTLEKNQIQVFSIGHILKENIINPTTFQVKEFLETLAKDNDIQTNGQIEESLIHKDWFDINKLQCHTVSDTTLQAFDVENLTTEFMPCQFRKGWSKATLDGDNRDFMRCAGKTMNEPNLKKQFIRRLFYDDYDKGYITGNSFIKEYASLKSNRQLIKFIVSVNEQDIRHCNSINRRNNKISYIKPNIEKVPFCKTVISKTKLAEEECVNLVVPMDWKNDITAHNPVRQSNEKNPSISILEKGAYCRTETGKVDSIQQDQGICLPYNLPSKMTTKPNGFYISNSGFEYPEPTEYSCHEFNNSRYDRIRMAFVSKTKTLKNLKLVDVGKDEASASKLENFFDNKLTTITTTEEGSIIELFSNCVDKKQKHFHSGIITFNTNNLKPQPYLIDIPADTTIEEPLFKDFGLSKDLELYTKVWLTKNYDTYKNIDKSAEIHINDFTDFQKLLFTTHSKQKNDNIHIISAAVCSNRDIKYLQQKSNYQIPEYVFECIVKGNRCQEIKKKENMHVKIEYMNQQLWLIPKHDLIIKNHGPMRVSNTCDSKTIDYLLDLLNYKKTGITGQDFFLVSNQLLKNQKPMHKTNIKPCKSTSLCVDRNANIKKSTGTTTCSIDVDIGYEEKQSLAWDAIFMDPIFYLRTYKNAVVPLKFDVIVYKIKECGNYKQTTKRRLQLLSDMATIEYGGSVSSIFNILATMNNTKPQMISFADTLIDNLHEQWPLATNTNEAREQLYEQITKLYTEDLLCLHNSYIFYIGLAFVLHYVVLLILSTIFSCLPDTITGKPVSIFYQPNSR